MLTKEILLKDYSAIQLAKKLDVTRDNVYKWIKQGYIPRNYIFQVQKITGCTLSQLDSYLFRELI
jgi:predicted DNA-binding protein YlxM (UPF0122 family)